MSLTLSYFDTSKDCLVYADASGVAPAYVSVRELQAIGWKATTAGLMTVLPRPPSGPSGLIVPGGRR